MLISHIIVEHTEQKKGIALMGSCRIAASSFVSILLLAVVLHSRPTYGGSSAYGGSSRGPVPSPRISRGRVENQASGRRNSWHNKLWRAASDKLSGWGPIRPFERISGMWKRATGGGKAGYTLDRSKLSPTAKSFADRILVADPGASATLSSILNQDGKLNSVLKSAGVRPTSGRHYQPTVFDKNAEFTSGKRPFIPMVMYNVNQAQLKSLEKQFAIDTKNGLSKALGQEENMGVVSSESYQPGSKTLWRMAVYPSKVCLCGYRCAHVIRLPPSFFCYRTSQGSIALDSTVKEFRAGQKGKDLFL